MRNLELAACHDFFQGPLRFKGLWLACGIIASTVATSVVADGVSLDRSISMGSWSAQAMRYLVRRPVCAWSTTPDGVYRVMASTAENAASFEMLGDLGHSVRFEVRWRDNDASETWERLIPGLPSSMRYRFSPAANCPGGRAQIQIRLSKGDADRVPGGFYSSALTITLVSE